MIFIMGRNLQCYYLNGNRRQFCYMNKQALQWIAGIKQVFRILANSALEWCYLNVA